LLILITLKYIPETNQYLAMRIHVLAQGNNRSVDGPGTND